MTAITQEQSAPPQIPLVVWHEGRRSMCFLDDMGKATFVIAAETLRKMGFIGDDADYRRSLPRIDPSPLAAPPPPPGFGRPPTRHLRFP